MNRQLVLLLIGISVSLCLVALNLQLIYFILDNPYLSTHSKKTWPTEALTWAPILDFKETTLAAEAESAPDSPQAAK